MLKIGKNNLSSFTMQDLEKILTSKEYDICPDFINSMINMDIIKINNQWGSIIEYEFANKTFYTYYIIKSSEEL